MAVFSCWAQNLTEIWPNGGGTIFNFPKEGDWGTLEISKSKLVDLCDLSKIKSLRIDFQENNSSDYYESRDRDKAFPIMYKPEGTNRCGDPMPFWDAKDNTYKVLYLYETTNNDENNFHPIYGISTKDGFTNTNLGLVFAAGTTPTQQDAAIGTGCCFYNEADQLYHLFYTGNRPEVHNSTYKDPREAVMHATSSDLKNWTKDYPILKATVDNGASTWDFRDPEVFKADDDKWHMVVATKINQATDAEKSVLMEFVSDNLDLSSWTYKGIFLHCMWGDKNGKRFYECPNVFKMGDYWYLVYSEILNGIRKVQYFKAEASGTDGLNGLRNVVTLSDDYTPTWPDDHEGYLNGRGLYAGKTASNGTERMMWGWSSFYDGSKDGCEWAGALVPSKVKQNDDGTLVLVEPSAFAANYNTEKSNAGVTDGDVITYGRLGYHNRISCKVTMNSAAKFGFRFGGVTDKYGVTLNIEKDNTKCVVKYLPEGGGYDVKYDSYAFDYPDDGVFNIVIDTDNSALTMYVNDQCAYSCRIDHTARNQWQFRNYQGGGATISDLRVKEYEDYDSEYVMNVRTSWDNNDNAKIALDGSPLIEKHENYAVVNLANVDLTKKFEGNDNLLIQVHPEFLSSMIATKVSVAGAEPLWQGEFKCDWLPEYGNVTLKLPSSKFANLRVGQKIVVEYEMDEAHKVDEIELHDGFTILPGTRYKHYVEYDSGNPTQSVSVYVTHGMFAHIMKVGFEVTGRAFTIKKIWLLDRPEQENIKASSIWSGLIWSQSNHQSYDYDGEGSWEATDANTRTLDFACECLETETGPTGSFINLDNYKAMRFYYTTESYGDFNPRFDVMTGFESPHGTYSTTTSTSYKERQRYAELQITDALRNELKTASQKEQPNNRFFVRINNGGKAFNLTDITLVPGAMTLAADAVSTFSSMENVLVSGAKVYTMKVVDDKLVCTRIADGRVPAGTGVILYNDTQSEVTATFTTVAESITLPYANSDNQLRATSLTDHNLQDVLEVDAEKIYCLYGGTKIFGPFPSTSFQSNRAYLPVSAEINGNIGNAKPIAMYFEEPTGISDITSNESHCNLRGDVFNIAGQRIKSNYRGIIIRNNKKYYVK